MIDLAFWAKIKNEVFSFFLMMMMMIPLAQFLRASSGRLVSFNSFFEQNEKKNTLLNKVFLFLFMFFFNLIFLLIFFFLI